jgi:competence protein ComFA
LLFVPTIAYGTRLEDRLNRQGFASGCISSVRTDSSVILRRFREKEWLFLVTTTILERGVTFKDIDVGVMSAERSVFDMDTLVQISGRVGRDPSHPHGEIIFFCEEKTVSMVRAVHFIKSMNKMAGKAGSIHDGM